MSINWGELADQYSTKWAKVGTYKTKVKAVKVGDKSDKGSCPVEIEYEKVDGETIPKTRYYLSFKENANTNWRAYQHMCIMKALSKSEENAKKAVENAEGTGGQGATIEAYTKSYAALGEKHLEVEVEVFEEEGNDGRMYTRSMLIGDSCLSTKSSPKKEVKAVESTEPLGGEPVDLKDVPF